MESQQGVQSVELTALKNPLILTKILKQAEIPLKTCRLVSSFWNEMVLSLPNTRLALSLSHDDDQNEMSFSELCSSVDARLATRVSYFGWRKAESFVPNLTQICDQFGDTVQILELSIAVQTNLPAVYQLLKNSCPNLQQLRISCLSTQNSASSTDLIPGGEIVPVRRSLTSFMVTTVEVEVTAHLSSFIDVVINASPNLKEVTLPWGVSQDLSNSKCLNSLTIALDNADPREIVKAEDKLSDLSRMLCQVSDQLVTLNFDYVDINGEFDKTNNFKKNQYRLPTEKMSKLRTFQNRMTDVFRCDDLLPIILPNLKTLMIGKAYEKSKCVDEILQTICHSNNKIFPNMKNLTVMELHDPKLLNRLVTAFPNLDMLNLDMLKTTDFAGKKSRMKLGVVLKTCRGWKALKHLELALPKYPEDIEDVIQALLKAKELFKQLKTFTLTTLDCDNEIYDLSEDEMNLFKKFLIAIRGMERVEISSLCFTKESAESIHAFMALKKMSVDKFSVVEEMSDDEDEAASDDGSGSDDFEDDDEELYMDDDSVDFDFEDDWRSDSDDDSD
ncbi:uncharacterized protein LOC110861075 [Folsomia candida]|uniref:F-box domain-containing protein n=1 Tax=Folsomia candida TaxID=158441 RepID=A0A226D289_FOLCA|nr:uncharacterized protein LOC110861075 [Folsomia candida]OXA39695.1 hypothetical protein Fcan01_25528 [Folsomia candida]